MIKRWTNGKSHPELFPIYEQTQLAVYIASVRETATTKPQQTLCIYATRGLCAVDFQIGLSDREGGFFSNRKE